jgi:hypothetical protein
MLWGSSLIFSHLANLNSVKCCNQPIVVGNDSMDFQPNKSKTDNEERLTMLWRSSLRFSQSFNHSWVKCCNWPIVVGRIL